MRWRLTCDRCKGNGEVITDWKRYLTGDTGDKTVTECSDCDGRGYFCDEGRA